MRFLRPFICLFVICLLSSLKGNAQYFVISKSNVKRIPIVVSQESSADQKHAAELLKKYFDTIFDSNVSIKNTKPKKNFIELKTDSTAAGDAYKVQIGTNHVTIRGGVRKGCTYGVIAFLERFFGCTYLSPTHQVIPKLNKVRLIPFQFGSFPKNDVRIINLYFGENQEYRDWLRLNSIEEVYPKGYFVHTFHRLLPWEEYFSEHPEYFALQNGKRTIDQLCPSNPEVRNLITEKLKAEMLLQPEKAKWSVSQNDNFTYCQCDHCSKIIAEEESPAGPIIHLVNDIAARFPDKIISTLAYQYSRKAPVKVKPLSNVEVMLCTIEIMRHVPIETNPECADFKKDIEDWGKICSNIFLWDYTINFNHSISPFPNLHVLQPNIQFFTKNNVNALFEQSNSSTGYEFSELKAYLLSALMWNPEADFNGLLDKFLVAYYGKAAPMIKSYIKELENELNENQSKLWIYEHPVVHQDGLFSKENLKQYKNIFDAAEIAVADDSIFLNHVKLARLPLQYAEMEIATNNMFSDRGWYQLVNGKTIPNEELLETLAEFENTCRKNSVSTVNESKLTPEDYIRSLRRMIDVNIEGNLAFGKKMSASPTPDPQYQKGDLSYLTNGVNGASDYNIHWLGWFGKDAELTLDLEDIVKAENITINSLWNGKSWILHPKQVTCSISINGEHFIEIGTVEVKGNQEQDEIIRTYNFLVKNEVYRYVKFTIKGTGKLPNWHPSAGEPSWFFLDEITVN